MQWIPAYYGSLTTVNQTVTNITETRLHAYEHTNPHLGKTHGHASLSYTHICTQTVQTICEAPWKKKIPLVD